MPSLNKPFLDGQSQRMCLPDFQVESFGAFKVEGCIEISDNDGKVSLSLLTINF